MVSVGSYKRWGLSDTRANLVGSCRILQRVHILRGLQRLYLRRNVRSHAHIILKEAQVLSSAPGE